MNNTNLNFNSVENIPILNAQAGSVSQSVSEASSLKPVDLR